MMRKVPDSGAQDKCNEREQAVIGVGGKRKLLESPSFPSTAVQLSHTRLTGVVSMLSKLGNHALFKVTKYFCQSFTSSEKKEKY